MVIIEFTVTGQLLKLNTDLRKAKVTSDTINYFKCHFDFNDVWNGYDIRVYFKNASFNITKSSILDEAGYCYIPWEVLAHTGIILCNVTGIKYVDGEPTRLTAGPVQLFVHNFGSEEQIIKKISEGKATVDPLNVFRQKEEGTIEPDYQETPTPTEYEQFVARVKAYSDAALDAKAEALSAKADAILAKNAAELAEHKIAYMTASAETGDAGTAASVTRTDYDDYFNLHFTIPKGDPGVDGVDGTDGQDGADGFSPSASVSKVDNVATITITDKDGTTTAEVYDGSGGGASAFIAEYGVTSYADIKDAYDEDAIIICMVDDSGNTAIHQLAYFDDANDGFIFTELTDNGWHWASIVSGDTWDDGYFQFASTDTATELRNGLMDALDKQKLDGIASGAEVNVQSDWNQSTNTADDYIKNKPTIPPKNIWYGTCSTATSTDAKTVTTTSGDFTLTTGNIVKVKFSHECSDSSALTTLNVDGTGATFVAYAGSTSSSGLWKDGEVVDFVYDGSNFVLTEGGRATTSYWGMTKLSSSTSSTSTALAATPSAVKVAYDLADSKQDELVSGTNIKTINNESLLGSGNITTGNPWASMYIEGISVNNTATKVTGLTMSMGANSTDYFDIGTSNQIKIKKAGTYKITVYFRTTAITSAGNVKRISCYVNGNESAVAMARLNTWEDAMSVTFRDLNANDVLTMYKRAEDGGSTYGAARILVEAM